MLEFRQPQLLEAFFLKFKCQITWKSLVKQVKKNYGSLHLYHLKNYLWIY